jgi:hypothetical protein
MKLVQSERLASLEQRLTDHESRCEERLSEIKATSTSTLKAVEGLKGRVWTIVMALLAWAMAQVWAASEHRLTRLETAGPGAVQTVARAD